MFRTRGLIAGLVLLAAATSACSGGNAPTGPTPSESTPPQETSGNPPAPGPPSSTDPPAPQTPPTASVPEITTQPKSQTIDAGAAATLAVKASGSATLKYRWYVGASGQTGSPVEGATSDRFTTPKLTQTTKYWVRVSNSVGGVDSETATITIAAPDRPADRAPTITAHPKGKTIAAGQSATLSVTAAGTAPLTYKWYQGATGNTSTPVSAGPGATYTTPALTSTTRFWVRVSNSVGAVDSDDATITVSAPGGNTGFEDEVRGLLNSRRSAGAVCGTTSYASTTGLAMNATLRSAARGHSQDMAANDYFSHTSLDGRTFDQRIRNAGYTGSGPLGENIAAGQTSPQSVVNGWMNSPGHCRNIMSPDFRAVGVGYAYDANSTYRHYWTLSFGGS